MASVRTGLGADRVLFKLKRSVDAGNYYEAHQMYRSIAFRYSNSKKYNQLESLLFDGANSFLLKDQVTSGADLAGLYLKAVDENPMYKTNEKVDDKTRDETINRIMALFKLLPVKTPERLKFVQSIIKLSTTSLNLSEIHRRIAIHLVDNNEYSEARYHFLRSVGSGNDKAQDCAKLLIDLHSSSGYKSEVDLFIAQFVLQLLCLKSLNPFPQPSKPIEENKPKWHKFPITSPPLVPIDSRLIPSWNLAGETFQEYVTQHPHLSEDRAPQFKSPLLNYLWFVLLTIQKGERETFTSLCELYHEALSRDPSFADLIERIGELYFGIPSARPRGLLDNILNSLVDEPDQEAAGNSTAAPSNGASSSDNQNSQSNAARQLQSEDLD